MLKLRRLVCPICRMTYGQRGRHVGDWPRLWRLGGLCRDLSQGQRRPCVGRLMPLEAYQRAEWRRNEEA